MKYFNELSKSLCFKVKKSMQTIQQQKTIIGHQCWARLFTKIRFRVL